MSNLLVNNTSLSGLTILLLALCLVMLQWVFRRWLWPRLNGSIGEALVARKLDNLSKKDYIVHNDLYLSKNGRIVQIDHLVISIYGVFVIETKHYRGWIFGSEHKKYWTQIFRTKKVKFFNPIRQNKGHVNFIEHLSVHLRKGRIFSIVVFSGKAELKRLRTSTPVVYRRRLLRTIKSHREVVLTHQQMNRINSVIKKHSRSDKKVAREHLHQVKEKIMKSRANNESSMCPSCGGPLKERRGKYGAFVGCSNFPSCKYSRSLK